MSGVFCKQIDSYFTNGREKKEKKREKKEQAKEKSFYAFNTFLISFVSFHTLMHKFKPI